MNTREHAQYGCRAVERGTPDYGKNGHDFEGVMTDAGDTVANVLHYVFSRSTAESLDEREEDALNLLQTARRHFSAEIRGEL